MTVASGHWRFRIASRLLLRSLIEEEAGKGAAPKEVLNTVEDQVPEKEYEDEAPHKEVDDKASQKDDEKKPQAKETPAKWDEVWTPASVVKPSSKLKKKKVLPELLPLLQVGESTRDKEGRKEELSAISLGELRPKQSTAIRYLQLWKDVLFLRINLELTKRTELKTK